MKDEDFHSRTAQKAQVGLTNQSHRRRITQGEEALSQRVWQSDSSADVLEPEDELMLRRIKSRIVAKDKNIIATSVPRPEVKPTFESSVQDSPELSTEDEQMLRRVQARLFARGASAEGLPSASTIGNYEILELLDEGAMGKVYMAVHKGLRRKVALKLQKERRPSPRNRERMLREARSLARLQHPNVVRVLDVGEHEGRVYLTMELVEGKTLAQLQASSDLGWQTLLHLYIEAGRGLAAAHAAGLVHRDFKPDNVVVDRNQLAQILDFGLACTAEEIEVAQAQTDAWRQEESGMIERSVTERLTATGTILGTPAYMAPEVLVSKPATMLSDQFSFCVALYEALYVQMPFPGKTPEALFTAMQDDQLRPPPVDRPAIPRWLFRVLEQGLSLRSEDRFPSMTALLAELGRDRRRRWSSLRWSRGVAAGVAGLLLATGGLCPLGDSMWPPTERVDGPLVDPELRCALPAQEMRTQWSAMRDDRQLWYGDGDASAIEHWRDAEVDAFAERWQSSCVSDPEGQFDSCRRRAAADFGQLLDLARSHFPPTAMFSALSEDLELCLESRPASSCQGPSSESEAPKLLAEARGWFRYGRLGEARVRAERSLKLAQNDGDELTQIRTQVLLGGIERQSGAIEAARSRLDDAAARALACHDDVLTVDAELERAEVEVLHSGRPNDARRSLRRVEQLLARPAMQSMTLRRARLLETEGGVSLYLERRCESALADFEAVLELRQAEVDGRLVREEPVAPLSRLVAAARLNRARALAKCGGRSPDEVIAAFELARTEFLDAVGNAEHPARAEYEFNLGVALFIFGRYERALDHYEQARHILRLHHGPDNPRVGATHRAMAESLRKLDRLTEAREHAQANLEIRLRAERDEGTPLAVAEAYDTLGVIEAERGLSDEAVKLHQGAIDELAPPSRTQPHSAIEAHQLMLSYTNLAIAWWEPALRGDPRAVEAAWQATQAARRWLAAIPDEQPLAMLVLMEARLLDRRVKRKQACKHAKSSFDADKEVSKTDGGRLLQRWVDTHCSKR